MGFAVEAEFAALATSITVPGPAETTGARR